MEDLSVRPIDARSSSVQPTSLIHVAVGERCQRHLDHLRAALAHVDETLDDGLSRVQVARQLGQLRDRHALVSHAFDVEPGVQERENETQIAGDRRLARKHELDLLLESVIAVVDLVVERDDLVAELDVLRPQRIDDTADRPEDDLAGFLESGFEGVQLRLEPDSHPNRPVT